MTSPEEEARDSLREFLQMTDAQRVALGDQAKALIHDQCPQAEPALEKGAEYTAMLMDLIEEDPEMGLYVVAATEAALDLLRAVALKKLRGEE